MKFPERLQGTDGIRGRTLKSSDPEVAGLTPLEALLEKRIITEEFVELYSYCFISLLIKMKIISPGDEVLVGWDPRDKSGLITKASIKGIRKAGGFATSLGIIPTPALPLYMAYKGAKAGVMITASHNPADQNGIKLFLYPMGLKLFPEDDKVLTQVVYKTDYDNVKSIKLSGGFRDEHGKVLKVFFDFMLDSRNSWIEKENFIKDGILIVDSANGSFSGIASQVFKRSGFKKVIDVNDDIKGEVNRNSGVSDISGFTEISPSMVFEKKGAPFPKFAENSALKKIFKIGRIYREKILKKETFVSGAIFDADGDRFFRLEYDPVRDEILVLAGDEIAFVQGKFLIEKDASKYKNSYYVNTIESDLKAALSAKELGFRITSTGVGDKWLLANSIIGVLNSFLRFVSGKNDIKNRSEIRDLRNTVKRIQDLNSISVFRLANAFKNIDLIREMIGEDEFTRWIEKSVFNFAVGSEESGHNITGGLIRDKKRSLQPVFIGNGLKSALNSFASTCSLYWHRNRHFKGYIESLRSPFIAGMKKTIYIYYTDKGRFFDGSESWKAVKSLTKKLVRFYFKNKIKLKTEIKKEEPDLLYFSLIDSRRKVRGVIFIRNSGTEDKTGVDLRGKKEDAEVLSEIGEEITGFLRKVLKDYENSYAKIQKLIVETINKHGRIEKGSLIKLLDEEKTEPSDLITRVLMETEKREGLIKRVLAKGVKKDSYCLTNRGRKWLEG